MKEQPLARPVLHIRFPNRTNSSKVSGVWLRAVVASQVLPHPLVGRITSFLYNFVLVSYKNRGKDCCYYED